MNPGLVIKLRPSGPWRIGPDSGARNRVDVIYHSDSLYSAVTAAMARLGWLEEWLEGTARAGSPAVSFSSCFPYLDDITFVVPPRTIWPPASPSAKAARVRWRSARFVPLTVVQSILAGQRLDENQWTVDGPSDCLVPAGGPGPFRTSVRWSAGVDRLTGASERHSMACIEFRAGSGLWTVVSFEDEAAQTRWSGPVKAAFRLLADTGFGGERSRGWGRSDAPEFIDGMLPALILPLPTESTAVVAPAEVVEAAVKAVSPVAPLVVEAAQPEAPAVDAAPGSEVPATEAAPAAESEVPAVQATPVAETETPPAEEAPAVEPDPPIVESPPATEPGNLTVEAAPATESEALAVETAPITESEAPVVEAAPATEAEAPTAEAPTVAELAAPAGEAAPAAEPETPGVERAPATEPEAPAAEAAPVKESEVPDANDRPVVEPAEFEAPAAKAALVAESKAPAVESIAPPVVAAPTHPHWLLSLFTPAPADSVDWRRGNYAVLARGGRVESPAGSGELKKQIQMVAEGSVLYAEATPRGSAANVAPDGFAHPVFRAGFALAIPLPEVR